MTEHATSADFFDPTGTLKAMRDAGLESWSKAMTSLVHGDTFAGANGAMLDALLASSAPFRKSLEAVMAQTLANLSLPSRDELRSVAERITHLEMRLDDMDAKVDELLSLARRGSS
ncbi:MAG TPA: hypothetical protein PKC18_09740 [Lacipirellulaceae bacterium]|nr:hypothetical protein [Lacipirellulaceae bacterium]